jgi:hypothetical protein
MEAEASMVRRTSGTYPQELGAWADPKVAGCPLFRVSLCQSCAKERGLRGSGLLLCAWEGRRFPSGYRVVRSFAVNATAKPVDQMKNTPVRPAMRRKAFWVTSVFQGRKDSSAATWMKRGRKTSQAQPETKRSGRRGYGRIMQALQAREVVADRRSSKNDEHIEVASSRLEGSCCR